MDISEQVYCLFSGKVEERDGSYVVEVPEQELQLGELQADKTYRVAVLSAPATNEANSTDATAEPEQVSRTPPVEEGEQRTVEIEDIGDQGDGITRVERGFVVIVPDTNQSERVTIEIGMYARMLPWQKLSIASVTTSSLKHSFSLSVDEGV